jgi:hypothetical protein
MSRTITVSDELYARLEGAAHRWGLTGVEQLLERVADPPATDEDELRRRAEVVAAIDAHRAELLQKYGVMPDSTDLIREDRER